MRIAFLSFVALLAMLAGSQKATAQDAIDKTKAGAFDKRLFAGPLAKVNYACFVRAYDAEHLAKHPKQKVAAIKLLVSAENPPDEKVTNYSFRLGVKFRDRSGLFDSSGTCNHMIPEDAPDEIRFGCGVDCDGGGIQTALAKDDKSAVVRLERVRIWKTSKPDDETTDLEAGTDDRVFRLDRVDNKECASVVTDRKILAALRRK